MNRIGPGQDEEPLYAHNCLTLADAVEAYTAGSAHVNHRDDDTGRIEVGCLADLVTLDRNVFADPRDEIADAEVVSTYVEGELVHHLS